jgi:hypothetical protein
MGKRAAAFCRRASAWLQRLRVATFGRFAPVLLRRIGQRLECNRAGVSCVALRDEAAIVAPRRAARATRPVRSDKEWRATFA